jgi:hypothetical protein
MPSVNEAVAFAVQVTCLHCRDKSILSNQEPASFGVKPGAPIAACVKRLTAHPLPAWKLVADVSLPSAGEFDHPGP